MGAGNLPPGRATLCCFRQRPLREMRLAECRHRLLIRACPVMALSESRQLAYRPDLPESGELDSLVMLKK